MRLCCSIGLFFFCLSFTAHAADGQKSPSVPKNDWSNFAAGKLSIHADAYYYSWESDGGAKGAQFISPITFAYQKGNLDLGFRSAWVESRNKTEGLEGRVSTFTDSALSASYTQKLPLGITVRYNLDYNAPTGTAALEGIEKNAIMDGHLVQQTRFGEGHNVTPGVIVSKVINNNLSLGAGLSYTGRGAYDPNSDVENDELDPGNETRLTVQSNYGTKNVSMNSRLALQKSATTTVNGFDYFEKGDKADLSITATLKALPKQQQLTFGVGYSKQRPDTYVSRITGNFEKESTNINGDNQYAFISYARPWAGKNIFRAKANWYQQKANSYDQFNDLYNAGRVKKSIELGYDRLLNKKSKLSFSASTFRLNEKATPATLRDTEYSGEIYSLSYKYKF